MKLCAVVAASDNDVIGRGNALPWHLPADLAFFKRTTLGHPVLMGRRTFESIGRPLPGRRNLVMSRREFVFPGTEHVKSIEEAVAKVSDQEALMVIGGREIFDLAMPMLDVIFLTRVHCTIEGDTFLSKLDPEEWREVSREYRAPDERNPVAMSFIRLERNPPAA
jgi:dihydrofolate reductase